MSLKQNKPEKQVMPRLPSYCHSGCCCIKSLPKLSPRARVTNVSHHPPQYISSQENRESYSTNLGIPSYTAAKSQTCVSPLSKMPKHKDSDSLLELTNNSSLHSSDESKNEAIVSFNTKTKLNDNQAPHSDIDYNQNNSKCDNDSRRIIERRYQKKTNSRGVSLLPSHHATLNVSSKQSSSSKSSSNKATSIKYRSKNSSLHSNSTSVGLSKSVKSSASTVAPQSPSSVVCTSSTTASLFATLCSCSTLAHHYKALPHAPLILQNSPSSLHAHTFRSLSHTLPHLSPLTDASNDSSDRHFNSLSTTTAAVLSTSVTSSSSTLTAFGRDNCQDGGSGGRLRTDDVSSAHHTLARDILRDLHKTLPREITTKSVCSTSTPDHVEAVMFLCADQNCLNQQQSSINSSSSAQPQMIPGGNCILRGE